MGNIVKTAKCRFCGQMTQIEADEKLTAAQAEEQATMTCNCTEAVEYQKEKQRKEKAMMNVSALFGENAAPLLFFIDKAKKSAITQTFPICARSLYNHCHKHVLHSPLFSVYLANTVPIIRKKYAFSICDKKCDGFCNF